jgi:diacylglycerol kinase family enzyme
MGPSQDPVLIVNPASGGGKAQRHHLVDACRRRGIEPIVLEPGGDPSALAVEAVDHGADVIGMAGGDGSQAAVAAVSAEHEIAYVCVPAGTRNHFALDLGIDTDNPVGALDAFFDAAERRIDLGTVNGRAFVNNVSLGVYGAIVQSPQYRDAKFRTVIEMLPELIGPGIEPFDLRFTRPAGSAQRGAHLVLVSNNRYRLDRVGRRGTRGGIDDATLGVVALRIGPPPTGWRGEWTAPTFLVDSDTTVKAGIDGEAVALDPPLRFDCSPSVLRVRVPKGR